MKMTKHQIAKQIKQIESLFDDNKKPTTNNVQIVESNKDYKCDVHGRRVSNGSIHSTLSKRDSIGSTNSINRRASAERSFNNDLKQNSSNNNNNININNNNYNNNSKLGPRRESMPVLNASSNFYNRVYVPKPKNDSEQITPASFPSILRKSSVSLSQNTLRSASSKQQLNQSNSNLSKSREHIYHSLYCDKSKIVNDKINLNKRNSFCGDLRRSDVGFGHTDSTNSNSIYLRRDSSGNINLCRRDSIGSSASRRNSINASDPRSSNNRRHESVPRDYVSSAASVTSETTATNPKMVSVSITTTPHSILRKRSPVNGEQLDVTAEDNQLTKDNLKKHVTLLDRVDGTWKRRPSVDSGGSSTTRRISMDSLDLRRNSWDFRGSDSSSEKVIMLAYY